MTLVRSTLYFLGVIPLTLFFVPLSLLISPLPFPTRYKIVSRWALYNLWWLEKMCNLRSRIEGLEHIPRGPAIIMCNHQSAWETLKLQEIFSPQVWVLKRELLWIPLFGWGLATLKPIAINRSSGKKAVQQVLEQGTERLKQGIWVTIFPEGTRIKPGTTRRYGKSGGLLAEKSGYPIVPVAHNAGLFWPRRGFLKRPGVIDMVIGPIIDPKGKTADEITQEVKQWIDSTAMELYERQKAQARDDT